MTTCICQEYDSGLCLVFADKQGKGRYFVEIPDSKLQCDGRCLQIDQEAFWIGASVVDSTGQTLEDLPELSACPRIIPLKDTFIPVRIRRMSGQKSLTEFPEF